MKIKQIIKKYNYPEDLANFLTIVYANFLKYFWLLIFVLDLSYYYYLL